LGLNQGPNKIGSAFGIPDVRHSTVFGIPAFDIIKFGIPSFGVVKNGILLFGIVS
jgi:hypothetical protein